MHLAKRISMGGTARSVTRVQATLSGCFACEYFHELPLCQGVQTKKNPDGEQPHALFVRFSGEYRPRLATVSDQCSTLREALPGFQACVAGIFIATLCNGAPCFKSGASTHYAQRHRNRREFELVALSQVVSVHLKCGWRCSP
jgi:hypothetical protein